jgi:hypothetical protein
MGRERENTGMMVGRFVLVLVVVVIIFERIIHIVIAGSMQV